MQQARDDWTVHNDSNNPAFGDVLDASVARRDFLSGGATAVGLWLLGARPSLASEGLLQFSAIAASSADTVRVPNDHSARVLFAWGDPIADGPAWNPDASNSAADQEKQGGMHHDGMAYFPLTPRDGESERGLLAINHEYSDEGLLHPDGMKDWDLLKVRKSQAAHGVSIIEVVRRGETWSLDAKSKLARRITAFTPMRLSGPVAGHALVRTHGDPEGTRVLGTLNNCASGRTPWGTYLTCEENFRGYFHLPEVDGKLVRTAQQRRYAIQGDWGYRWHEHDTRFRVDIEPNEVNRFGWVVEIDPHDSKSVPVKRSALGRFAHETATFATTKDGRAVVYMGDDARFEYIYRFVSDKPYAPGDDAAARRKNRDVLDSGTLYVAQFQPGEKGEWIELSLDHPKLKSRFASMADLLVHARLAADAVGATKMDRPEWIAVHPQTGDCYVTCTNNSKRGLPGNPGTDAANPRPRNVYGHILRWSPTDGDHGAATFQWGVFLLAGHPEHPTQQGRGSVGGKSDGFGAPDGLWFDQRGVMWIQTDMSSSKIDKGDYVGLGNNQMLAADPATGEVRRFLTGPNRCEVTGIAATPDGTTMFVNIQHPGEPDRGPTENPAVLSSWPGKRGSRARSATVVIRKRGGGIVGS